MADLNLNHDSTITIDDDRPLAVRRPRRSSVGSLSNSRNNSRPATLHPHGIATPPETPKRIKKRVRFSDPGPAIESEYASSGLTPFIRRTSLSTPKSKRRQSTPARLWNRAGYDVEPASGTLQFAPLRQVLDGRVKRRIKRNGLSEEINVIEFDKRVEARGRKAEVERLKRELELKDLEVQSMRDEHDVASQIEGESGASITTTTTLSNKVQELEREIRDLKEELGRRESDSDTIDDPNNWTMAARDPYNYEDYDDMMITNYDADFEDMTGNDELMTTPTRLNTSFPSPPSTMPNTPCKSTHSTNAGIQASLPISDPEKETLKSQLQSLQAEISKLTSAVALNEDNATRLAEKLYEFIPIDESRDHNALDSALDTVLTQLALTQSQFLENSTAFSALSNEITALGFSASSPDEALETIAKQFRQARLDLEYLTPGETAEGFENEKLLGLLVDRIRVLIEKVKDRDASIDQYHEQEVLLRQQLNDRVSVMESLRGDLTLASTVVGSLREEIKDKETDSERLRAALEGYRNEVSSLEALISRVEEEGREKELGLRSEMDELQGRLENEVAKHDVTRLVNEGNEMLLPELERRLTAALEAAAEVQTRLDTLTEANATMTTERDAALAQLATLSSSICSATEVEKRDATIASLRSTIQDREQAHGSALALRDARVSELRSEIERVNEALKSAHSTILSLRKENKEVKERAERGKFVVMDMLKQIGRAEEMGRGWVEVEGLDSGASGVGIGKRRASSVDVMSTPRVERGQSAGAGGVVRRGGMFDAGLARRVSVGKSGKKRRRYDSGLGFLEEGEEGDDTMVEM
ncbi:hypothetical protein ONS95_006907 [Cadophora gregata]|uniref:uncharacterized protein n=1 Tax=Cadophora gregata TaxID=51156 RepID=UPI0026DC7E4D|nr:uncharacterized protein ONS95_006907 [Cadophora gregata]KAK0101754.1 hypothetical protein ONS95_006907 [Cadophora gregata]